MVQGNSEDIQLDEIAKEQYDKAFEDLSPEEKIEVLGGAGDRVRRESPYDLTEDFRHLGVESTIYHALTIEVIDDLGNPIEDVDIEIDGNVEGQTDSDGIFRITLPRGEYDLFITEDDYTSYDELLDLQEETELSVTIDYELLRPNDPNTIYWGVAEEPDDETPDKTLLESLGHESVDNDITFEFTVEASTDEHVWFAHPARLGKVYFSQTIGDFDYEDTYYDTVMIDADEGEEDYEVHMTPEDSLGEVTIETKEHTE